MKSRLTQKYYYDIVNNVIKNELVSVLDDYLNHLVKYENRDYVKLIIDTINEKDLYCFKIDEKGTNFSYDDLLIRLGFGNDCTNLYLNNKLIAILTRNHDNVINLHMRIRDYFNDILYI